MCRVRAAGTAVTALSGASKPARSATFSSRSGKWRRPPGHRYITGVMHARMAAAPVSWGVSDLPGWGHQMGRERVLAEARTLGFHAIEAGPEGWLPDDPGLTAQLLKRNRLRLAAGHVEAVLHRADVRREQLARVERRARWLSAAGAELLIVIATSGGSGYRP